MAHRAELVQCLYRSMHETLAAFDAPAAALDRSYAPGKWTLREMLLHMSDTETVLLERLRRTIAEDKATFTPFDENLWAKRLNYTTRDLGLARIQFEAARRNVIELAQTTDPKLDANVGTHTEAGPQTLAQNLSKVAKHTDHHLEQVRAMIAGTTWAPKK
jgi:uncharacterized damage-inducible protein DinB